MVRWYNGSTMVVGDAKAIPYGYDVIEWLLHMLYAHTQHRTAVLFKQLHHTVLKLIIVNSYYGKVPAHGGVSLVIESNTAVSTPSC